MKKIDLSSALSFACSLLVFIALSVSAQDTSENVSFKMRSQSELSQFEDFSRETGNEKEAVRTTAVWETDLYNSDGYDNHNYAMFKYGDIIYIYGLYYNYSEPYMYFRRIDAKTGELLKGDDDSYISKISVPSDKTGWPYESLSNFKSELSGSWLRFFTDDDGEIGLVSFIRNEKELGNSSKLKISVFHLDINTTFKNSELTFNDVISGDIYDDVFETYSNEKNIFNVYENFISEIFNVSGSLINGNLKFDFLLLRLDGDDADASNKWFHFEQNNPSGLVISRLNLKKEPVMKDHYYDPCTVSILENSSYIVSFPNNGVFLLDPIENSTDFGCVAKWEIPANDNELDTENTTFKSKCFTPVDIAGEEYYITTGAFPKIDVFNAKIDGSTATSFTLRRWRDKSDFSGVTDIISIPTVNNEFNYANVSNSYGKDKIIYTISQKCVVEYQYKTPTASGKALTRRPMSQDKGDWMKTICYLYSPSAGIGRYEFEPVYDGWLTNLNDIEDSVKPEINRSGERLWLDGNSATLKIFDIAGAIVFSSSNCTEANISALTPGCYLVSWGSAVSKILVK